MRVALVHDWLTGTRGGERVLLEMVRLFPEATLFTLFHFPGSVPPAIERLEIRTTPLQRLVSPELDYRKLLPLFAAAAETWDLSGFDLVLSSSHCVAKNARRGPDAVHVSYCHTPVRYLHDQFDAYFGARPGLVSLAARALRRPLAAWDVHTASRVDAFLANSENVRERIARLYGRPSRVVHPPADLDFFTPPPESARRSGFLIVSALAPYKRLEDAIDAAGRAGFSLTIAGFGPEDGRLRRRAGPSVRFVGSPTDAELRRLYQDAEALLMPGEEDFGIVPVEAQACGTPVVALGRGGARETVRDGVTGVLYEEPGPSGLLRGLERLARLRPKVEDLRSSAARFASGAFRHNLVTAVAEVLAERGLPGPARALEDRLEPRCV